MTMAAVSAESLRTLLGGWPGQIGICVCPAVGCHGVWPMDARAATTKMVIALASATAKRWVMIMFCVFADSSGARDRCLVEERDGGTKRPADTSNHLSQLRVDPCRRGHWLC